MLRSAYPGTTSRHIPCQCPEQCDGADQAFNIGLHDQPKDRLGNGAGKIALIMHLPRRGMMIGIGPVPVPVPVKGPRVRDRGNANEKLRFTSSILPSRSPG